MDAAVSRRLLLSAAAQQQSICMEDIDALSARLVVVDTHRGCRYSGIALHVDYSLESCFSSFQQLFSSTLSSTLSGRSAVVLSRTIDFKLDSHHHLIHQSQLVLEANLAS